MGKKSSGNNSTSKLVKASVGLKAINKAKHRLMRLLMKISRWENNQKNPNKVSTWNKNQKPHKRSRHDNWNTTGLKKHVTVLQAFIDKGAKSSV